MKAWEQNPDPEASIDCCIAHVFSWGHTVGASFHRRSAEYEFPEQASELPPSWQHLPPDQTFPQPPYICQDFHIRAAERHKRWTNSDLWLFDTDCDWHMPLFFTVREMTQRAKRIRTKERQMARKAVQRTRQAEKAASSFSGRTGPPTQSQGPPSWTNRSDEHKKKIRRNKRMRKLPTWICIVIVYQSNSQHRRSHLRPYGQNTLRVISHQRYCDVFRSFFRGQNQLRSSTFPKLLSQCLCQKSRSPTRTQSTRGRLRGLHHRNQGHQRNLSNLRIQQSPQKQSHLHQNTHQVRLGTTFHRVRLPGSMPARHLRKLNRCIRQIQAASNTDTSKSEG